MTSKQKCTEHAQATLPRLRELTFGCEVFTPNRTLHIVDYDTDLSGKVTRYWCREDRNGYRIEPFKKKSLKIIGHTPALGDWLELLGTIDDEYRIKSIDKIRGTLNVGMWHISDCQKNTYLHFSLATNEPDNWDTLKDLLNL